MKATVLTILCFLPLVVHCKYRFLGISSLQNTRLTVSGRILCQVDGTTYPVQFASIELKGTNDNSFFSKRSEYGSTETSSSGEFTIDFEVSNNIRPWLYIEVEYSYDGLYGELEVKSEILGEERVDKMPIQHHWSSSSIRMGDVTFENDHCRAYVMTYLAMEDYAMRTRGKSLPYDELEVITKAPLHAGTPYSTKDKIRIPSGYPYGYKTAKHELAHTVRHSLDGSFAHFLLDVIRYNYTQPHYCGKRTNEGFAFNEGWAQFWSGGCTEGLYGGTLSDHTIEGNVAQLLRRLMQRCRSTYRQLVEVLEENEGDIHSFKEFARAHNNLYRCM